MEGQAYSSSNVDHGGVQSAMHSVEIGENQHRREKCEFLSHSSIHLTSLYFSEVWEGEIIAGLYMG